MTYVYTRLRQNGLNFMLPNYYIYICCDFWYENNQCNKNNYALKKNNILLGYTSFYHAGYYIKYLLKSAQYLYKEDSISIYCKY